MDQTPHIVFLPTPGMGHLIPLAELTTRLVHRHRFSATFVTYAESASNAQTAFLSSLPPAAVTFLSLPPVDLADLPSTARNVTRICAAAARSVPAVAHLLRERKKMHNVVAFVADLFGAETLMAAKQVSIPAYMFFPSNLMMLSLMLHLPALHAATSCEYRDLPEPLRLPGCVPVPGGDLMNPVQDRKDDAYEWVVRQARMYGEAEGILVNTFDEIEPEASEVLKKVQPGRPPVYLVGPLIQAGSSTNYGSESSSWLNVQPRGSVLFVSFGSGGTLSRKQMTELALGLECSGQRFIWVVRSPSDQKADANYFNAQSASDPFEFLPEGFLERTRDVGLVVSSWTPQIEILKHESTGGFLTHCGWNSTLESVVHGVPMIAWPLYAEQKQNAVMLVEGPVRIALRAKAGSDGVVRKDAISRAVRELMEGEEGKAVRCKVKELQMAGAKALAEDGNSSKSLHQIANKWKKGML